MPRGPGMRAGGPGGAGGLGGKAPEMVACAKEAWIAVAWSSLTRVRKASWKEAWSSVAFDMSDDVIDAPKKSAPRRNAPKNRQLTNVAMKSG